MANGGPAVAAAVLTTERERSDGALARGRSPQRYEAVEWGALPDEEVGKRAEVFFFHR